MQTINILVSLFILSLQNLSRMVFSFYLVYDFSAHALLIKNIRLS